MSSTEKILQTSRIFLTKVRFAGICPGLGAVEGNSRVTLEPEADTSTIFANFHFLVSLALSPSDSTKRTMSPICGTSLFCHFAGLGMRWCNLWRKIVYHVVWMFWLALRSVSGPDPATRETGSSSDLWLFLPSFNRFGVMISHPISEVFCDWQIVQLIGDASKAGFPLNSSHWYVRVYCKLVEHLS